MGVNNYCGISASANDSLMGVKVIIVSSQLVLNDSFIWGGGLKVIIVASQLVLISSWGVKVIIVASQLVLMISSWG